MQSLEGESEDHMRGRVRPINYMRVPDTILTSAWRGCQCRC